MYATDDFIAQAVNELESNKQTRRVSAPQYARRRATKQKHLWRKTNQIVVRRRIGLSNMRQYARLFGAHPRTTLEKLTRYADTLI